MSESIRSVGDTGVEAFVQKLGAFRATLTARDQQMFDAMLVAAASTATDDVQAYAFTTLAAKHVALGALLALGIGAGTLSPITGSTVQAAPLDQQSLNNPTGGTLGFTLRDPPMQEQL